MDEESLRDQGNPQVLQQIIFMRPEIKRSLIAVSAIVVIAIVIIIYSSSRKSAPAMPVVTPVATSTKVLASSAVIGHSVQGRDITAYTYGNGPTHLLFVGGIHGGYEWNSVLLAYTFMDYIIANPEMISKDLTVAVIPDANPDAVFAVTGKEGRFDISDVSTSSKVLTAARFNADNVDLNRNFDCKWQPKSTWQTKTVSGGTSAFSEPESQTIREYIGSFQPSAAIFWHSQSNGVFASQCKNGILPKTLDIMNAYSKASGYPATKTFDAYATTGAADDWLASQKIPAITVELQTHSSIEWERNLAGIKAILGYFSDNK